MAGKIEIVPFRAEHLVDLSLADGHEFIGTMLTYEQAIALENAEHSYTGVIDGKPVFCAGVSEPWPKHFEAWAYMPRHTSKMMVQITRIVKRYFEFSDFVRVEAAIDCQFAAGRRWVELLGFELEAPVMRKYSPDGRDHSLYAKVK